MKYLTFIALLSGFFACGCDTSTNELTNVTTMSQNLTGKVNGDPVKVSLIDKTFDMPTGTFLLPSNWNVRHDIASNPSGGGFHRYFKEFSGPDGEMIVGVETTMFGAIMGTSFEGQLNQRLNKTLSNYISQAQYGQMRQSQTAMSTKSYRMVKQMMPDVQALEMEFTAQTNRGPVRGMVFLYMTDKGQYGVFFGDVVFAPENSFASAINTLMQMANTYEMNQQYVQAQRQVAQRNRAASQRMMAQSAQQHQQRMAMRQQSFNAHQNRMQQQSQLMDQQHSQWMNNFRNSGTGSTYSNNYSSHDAYIDAIHERQTFNDPYSGHETHKEGYYEHNYTNGLGDYYRTDDPSFNPNNLQGNWQRIEPNSPN